MPDAEPIRPLESMRLNVLVLYNDRWTHIQSTREHLTAFANRSRHRYFFLPAAQSPPSSDSRLKGFDDFAGRWPQAWDFDVFDAVVWHFVLPAYKSAQGWVSDFMADAVAERLAAYDGLKVLFVQDEYDTTATIWQAIRKAGVSLVMTCVPPEAQAYAYPPAEVPGVEFIQTLTGFAPDNRDLARFALPMAERRNRIAYRARTLPYRYGDLAREKYVIGVRTRELAQARGVPVDIEWTEDKRVYGDDWYRLLGSARAMLATESGSNVFDFYGDLHGTEEAERAMSYEAFHAHYLKDLDGKVSMNQVSPKIFEAIAVRTALVCFEGTYSGVIRPDEHFIPLRKDFANIDAVFAKLEDAAYLEALTERAYADVIGSGRYSYRAFVADFDSILENRVPQPPRAQIISAPILVRRRGEARPRAVQRAEPLEYILNDGVLHGDYQTRQLEADMTAVRERESTVFRAPADAPPEDARAAFVAGPDAVRCYDYWRNAGAALVLQDDGARITTPPTPWHYAAGVHLDYGGVRLDRQHAWIRLRVADVSGDVRAATYDADRDALGVEKALPQGQGPFAVYLPVLDDRGTLLLLRTGDTDQPGHATVLETAILSASLYSPAVLEAARKLGAPDA